MLDLKRTPREFKVGDKVFIRVKPRKCSFKSSKMKTSFVGYLDVIHVVNLMDYHLNLPANLSKLHNIFYVSLLKKYIPDPTHVLDMGKI